MPFGQRATALPSAALVAVLWFALFARAGARFALLFTAAHTAAFLLAAAAFIGAFTLRRSERRRGATLPRRLFAALLGQRVIVQLALLAQHLGQPPHCIGQLLFLRRQITLLTLTLLAGHAHALLAFAALLEL